MSAIRKHKKRPGLSKNRIAVTSLTRTQRERIFHLAAENYPVRLIAEDFAIKYSSVRHVVFAVWRDLYPNHFAKNGGILTMEHLRATAKTLKPEKKKA